MEAEKIGARRAVMLSVVVPCYNERDGVAELHRRVTAACLAQNPSYEIVLVIDGATDGTREAVFELAQKDDHVVAIDLARNYGHQIALSAGLEFCRGQRILILDADLQDPPELLGAMMAKMDEGFDVVYGQRAKRDGEGWFKLASASMFYRLLRRMVDVEIAPDTGDFRLMSRRALDYLNAMPERYRFIRGMVSWIGLRQAAFSYERQRRFAGATHYPLKKMILLAVDAMTSFSIAPLRFASLLGMLSGALGMVVLGYTLLEWSLGNVLPGWTSLAAIMLILGSVQLLVLGIFGEYLGRMYMETKRRPLYFVNEIVSRSDVAVENQDLPVHRLQEMVKRAARG
ncbi:MULTISPECIES: glycosyltransferase family 2 protein [unclassified Mesorhizobium]|uniref:glycosyltransferase family 2 protein n=1 Tax=unclassified Mesorhizobium TaxID=325217 RepID=UPI00112D972A|nr:MULTISPECIES: glycosyltransferase family 2 protein [unclassified Mesorhizobium]MCA0000718.1 glycosyltransferase family 2 protein [Mesorhizobium sp. B264B2A]MCA0007199.1 glycosyltransferase family 2 protein [Mesorhizobium sp. B264B1B]MCA0020476.1 glycosyltransferase family 2 protein [Mesorhizobium sp. B264B1A]TPJ49542.1 glycosyltransferase family 2 protein [Mesorhizobium sp. B2-6-6]